MQHHNTDERILSRHSSHEINLQPGEYLASQGPQPIFEMPTLADLRHDSEQKLQEVVSLPIVDQPSRMQASVVAGDLSKLEYQ